MSQVRSTMADIIARVRFITSDPAGPSQFATDDQIQDVLDQDQCREPVRYFVMRPEPTYTPSGIVWTHYYSRPFDHWEQTPTLIWTNFTTLAPDTPTRADLIRGHFSFAAGQLPAILIAGESYDVWLASADLLDARATAMSLTSFDFGADGKNFRASQVVANLRASAESCRERSRVLQAWAFRRDTTAAHEHRHTAVGAVSAGVPFLTGD